MSEHGRAFGRDLAVYGLSTAVVQGTTVVLTPILTRKLGPSGYGIYELLQVAIGFLGILLVLGTDLAVLKVFHDDDDPAHHRQVVSTGSAIVVGTTLLGTALIVAFSGQISAWLLGSTAHRPAVLAAALALPAIVFMNFSLQNLRVERRAWQYFTGSALGACVQLAMVVVLVLRSPSAASVFVGLAIGAFVSVAYAVWDARHLYRATFSFAPARTLLSFGIPLIFTGIAGWSVMFIDRILLTRYVSLAQIGYYGLANKVALLLNLVIYSFSAGWPPFILALSARDRGASIEVRARALNQFLVGVALVGVPAAALAPEAVRLVAGPGYLPAARVVPVLVLAYLLFATLPVTQVAMLVESRTRELAVPSIIAALLNIAGCLVLCPHFGIMGAAWATVLGFGFQAVAYYVRAQRIEHVPYPVGRTVLFFVLALPFLALGWWVPAGWGAGLLAKLALLLLFPTALLLARVVDGPATLALLREIRRRRWTEAG